MNAGQKIKKALEALGIQGVVTYSAVTKHPSEVRYTVRVNGKPFGVFDTERKTFIV